MVPATVRFFCPVGPNGHTPADFAYHYARALHQNGYPIRIIALSGAQLTMGAPAAHTTAPKWRCLAGAGCFTRPVTGRFVNIVCCPPGTQTGQPLSGQALAGSSPSAKADSPSQAAWAQTGAARIAQEATRDLVYEPSTALASCWYAEATANIAITFVPPVPSREELVALAERYNACVVSTEREAERLLSLGLGLEDPELKVDGFARLPIFSLTADLLLECEAVTQLLAEPAIATRKGAP